MSSPRRKRILFKEFVRENESKFTGKYPFLTAQQIHAKLKQSWKKACKEEIDNKTTKSPPKTNGPANHSKLERHSDSRHKTLSPAASPLAGNDLNDNEAHSNYSDSGGWYYESDGTLKNTDEQEQQDLPQTNGLTEETVNDVIEHTLNIELKEMYHDKEDSPEKGEEILSHLFHPMEKQQNKKCASKHSRLLASEEKEGESNFSGMFEEKDDIFL